MKKRSDHASFGIERRKRRDKDPALVEDQGRQSAEGGSSARSGNRKVNVEIEAPEDGQLHEINVQEGEFVKFGAVVAVIDPEPGCFSPGEWLKSPVQAM